jgi:hypothetical protein
MLIGSPVVFVSVMSCEEDVPTRCSPKSSELGDSVYGGEGTMILM